MGIADLPSVLSTGESITPGSAQEVVGIHAQAERFLCCWA